MRPAELAPKVVAGIDGSRSALLAALWAVDEAVDRDAALRLVYAVEPVVRVHPDVQNDSCNLASAEVAIREAIVAVQSRELPVKIEVEIRQQSALTALRELSTSAALICIGAIGYERRSRTELGSVARGLANAAECSVAIVRGAEPSGGIIAEVDPGTAGDTVLECAVREAVLRDAPLMVVSTVPVSVPNIGADGAKSAAGAQLESRLAYWRRQFPSLHTRVAITQEPLVTFVAPLAHDSRLLVVSRQRRCGMAELMGHSANQTLQETNCSLLICSPHGAL